MSARERQQAAKASCPTPSDSISTFYFHSYIIIEWTRFQCKYSVLIGGQLVERESAFDDVVAGSRYRRIELARRESWKRTDDKSQIQLVAMR